MLSALPGGLLGARHGPPPAGVVALHGWRRTGADFDRVLVRLAATAPDLPGFGAAAPPPGPWGAADYAAAVLPLCEEADPVVLAGHSFGGKVAVVLAATRPDRVRGLVLTGVPLLRPAGSRPPRASARYRLARALHRVGLVSDARMDARRHRSGSADYKAASGVMRDVLVRSIAEMDDGVYRRALGDLRCPVELVWGGSDRDVPPAVADEAAELAADVKVTVLAGVGHMTPLEAPDALRAAVERLL